MKIVWSPVALQRVREIADRISTDKPGAALRWAEDALDAVERLKEMLLSGRVVPELDRHEIREIIFGSYRIVYRVAEDSVLILTLRHGRQLLDETELDV